jgi:glycosyltransferase involved in cell wall biosynthesis
MSVDDAPSRNLSRRLPGATVLQVVPALIDEPGARAAINIASMLLRSGARAMVAGGPGMLVGQLQALGGEWVQLASASVNPFKVRRNAHALTELIAGERVDIVHAYCGPAAWSARTAVHETGAWLITSHAGAPAARRDIAALYQGALARGHRVITESEYAADLVLKRYDVSAERVVALPRSIDTARFDPTAVSPERIAVLRHSWGIRPGWRVILVPGRISPAKGQMDVVDAVRILLNGGMRGVVFVIAGDNHGDADYARAMAQRIDAQGIGALVRRTGHCADMPAAYAIADFILVPAVEPTTFDLIAAEGQAMGRPVIASAIGAFPEIVLAPPRVPEEHRTGWLVSPSDPITLARTIAATLALDRATRHMIGVQARRHAELRFSPARVAAAVLGLYTSLLAGER